MKSKLFFFFFVIPSRNHSDSELRVPNRTQAENLLVELKGDAQVVAEVKFLLHVYDVGCALLVKFL